MSTVSRTVDDVLACPRCLAPFRRIDSKLECTSDACGFRAEIREDIVCALESERGASFFDSHFPVMMHGSDEPGARAAFYDQQERLLTERLERATVVLDVGCGPRLPYKRPTQALVLGVERSYESLRQNADVDVRLFASATHLPIRSRSVDAIVCFYSLHHLVGASTEENEQLVRGALKQFARVLSPGGSLIVFEVSPWWVLDRAQRTFWNTCRRRVGGALDMFFWRHAKLDRLVAEHFPAGAVGEYRALHIPHFTTFPPVFALQRLRIPRILYPFHIGMHTWRMPSSVTGSK
jgi:ubiquinone/menaquinone biosynthesis C-methylase UbiE